MNKVFSTLNKKQLPYFFQVRQLMFYINNVYLLCCDGFPAESCDDAADEWTYDEYPQF